MALAFVDFGENTAAAEAAASRAEGAAARAEDAAAIATGVEHYYTTRAAGAAATPSGEIFVSDEEGSLAWYRSTGGGTYVFIDFMPTKTELDAADYRENVPLFAISELEPEAGTFPYFTGASTADLVTLTEAGITLLAAENPTEQRAVLELGSAATEDADTFATASAMAGHIADMEAHGISEFVATLVGSEGAFPLLGLLGVVYTTNANGSCFEFPIDTDGATLKLMWGSATSGSNGWSSNYDLPVELTGDYTKAALSATAAFINPSALDGNKISGEIVSTTQYRIGDDDFEPGPCYWIVVGI